MIEKLRVYCDESYVPGLRDCFSCVQEFFKGEYQLPIRNYARPTNWYVAGGLDFFSELFRREGFEDTGNSAHKVRYGDVLMMRIAHSPVTNHVAIYVGQNKILHHLEGKLSGFEDYSDKWRHRVDRVVRHPVVSSASDADVLAGFNKGLPAHLKRRLRGQSG